MASKLLMREKLRSLPFWQEEGGTCVMVVEKTPGRPGVESSERSGAVHKQLRLAKGSSAPRLWQQANKMAIEPPGATTLYHQQDA